jgi:hypothetical protein
VATPVIAPRKPGRPAKNAAAAALVASAPTLPAVPAPAALPEPAKPLAARKRVQTIAPGSASTPM